MKNLATNERYPLEYPNPVCVAVLMPHAPILVPAVGGERLREADATAGALRQAAARIVAAAPQSIVLVSPHSPRQATAFGIWQGARLQGTFEQFSTPGAGVDLPNDRELAAEIAAQALAVGTRTWEIPPGPLDHGALVPLWYLADAGWSGPTVVLSLNYPLEGGLEEMGRAITAAAAKLGRRIALIASGDMSHRLQPDAPAGYHPRAGQFDRLFMETVRRGAYRELPRLDAALQELAAEDVVDSTVIAAAAVGWSDQGHEVLSYEGPFGVGYGVAVLFEGRAAATASDSGLEELPRIARQSVQAVLSGGKIRPPKARGESQGQRHGVFVTIRGPDGELRGCVGTLGPKFANVVDETWHLAREAAFQDRRFSPVGLEEFPELGFEVSVLQPLEDVASEAALDPRCYGVVVSAEDGRRGTLLPGIPEIRTVAEQVDLARRKGGIASDEPVRLQRFTVTKFKDERLVE